VANATGIANSTLSNVLHGKRTLTRDHIERLCGYFRVGPDAFMAVRASDNNGDSTDAT
jgi:antitoxin component HigA of HigAB toxin-antitoxin module